MWQIGLGSRLPLATTRRLGCAAERYLRTRLNRIESRWLVASNSKFGFR
jgi:hypothetical protein